MFESTLRTFIVITFLSVVILFTSIIRNDNNSQSQADINIPLPEFTLQTLHLEKKITNEDLEDLFVLNVWASWCITCRVEHPYLMMLSKHKHLKILGINFKDKKINALKFLEELGDPYDYLAKDSSGKQSVNFGIYGIPESILIDSKFNILKKIIGPLNEKDLKEIKEIIKS